MTKLNQHIISKFQWKNSFDQKEKAMELQQRVSQWSNTKMQLEITEVFDRLCPLTQTWRIDSLTIDLGIIDYDNFEEEITLKLTQQLNSKLYELITNTEKRKEIIQISDTNTSQIEILNHYFLTGLLPWNFQESYHSINTIMAKQFKKNKQQLIEMLYKVGVVDENVRKRMAWQLQEPNIKKIVEALEQSNHRQIINFSEELTQIQQQQPLVQANKNDFKRNLWFWILNYLFTDRGTIFNKVAFMKSSIKQMSNHYNVGYAELLHLIELAIQHIQVSSSTKADFIVILNHLTKENEAQKSNEKSVEDSKEAYWDILSTLFKSPSLRKDSAKKLEFNQLIINLSKANKSRFRELFSSLNESATFWNPVIQDLEQPALESMFEAVIPVKSAMLLESIYFIEKLYKEMNVKLESFLLWEIGIQFIITYKNTPFDNKTFLHYAINALDKKNNDLKATILDQLPYVKVPASSKTIATLEIYTNLTSILKEDISEKKKMILSKSFEVLLQELVQLIKTNIRSSSQSIQIQKEIINYIQQNPKEAFETLQAFKDKTILKILFPYLLNKDHVKLFSTKITTSKIELLHSIQQAFKESGQIHTFQFINTLNSNKLYRLGIKLLLLNPEQSNHLFLEKVLQKLFTNLTPSQKLEFNTFISFLFKQEKIQAISTSTSNLEQIRLKLFQDNSKTIRKTEKPFLTQSLSLGTTNSSTIDTIMINGQIISIKELYENIATCLLNGYSKITWLNQSLSLKKMVESAVEINPNEVQKIFSDIPMTSERIKMLKENLVWEHFSIWIVNNSSSLTHKNLETLRLFYDFILHFINPKYKTAIQLSIWEITWKIIQQKANFQDSVKPFITHWLDQMIKENATNSNEIITIIQKNKIKINPVLKSIFMEYNTAFSRVASVSNETTNSEIKRCETEGLIEQLVISLITEQKVPEWFHSTEKTSATDLFHETLVFSPNTFIVVYKHNKIPQLRKQNLCNWIDFKKTITVIQDHNKGKQQLQVAEQLHSALGQLSLKGVSAKEIQEILFEKILVAWTENNWSLLATENIWKELLWDSCQKKNILKTDFLNAVDKIKYRLPPALQISFDQLVKANNPTVKTIPFNETKMEKKIEMKSIINENKGVPIHVKNAGIVIINNYVEMLINRLGLLHENQFKDTDSQLRAVQYLQYVVTGLTTTEEVFLPLNKIMCGLNPATPVMESIDITDSEKNLINGLISAVISYWPVIGETSVDGFRGNWLVRDGLLLEKEDRWELTVEKRAYDVLINQSPFSFSIIKYPWMNKPLHVAWPY